MGEVPLHSSQNVLQNRRSRRLYVCTCLDFFTFEWKNYFSPSAFPSRDVLQNFWASRVASVAQYRSSSLIDTAPPGRTAIGA